jgi:hypothetical protein
MCESCRKPALAARRDDAVHSRLMDAPGRVSAEELLATGRTYVSGADVVELEARAARGDGALVR